MPLTFYGEYAFLYSQGLFSPGRRRVGSIHQALQLHSRWLLRPVMEPLIMAINLGSQSFQVVFGYDIWIFTVLLTVDNCLFGVNNFFISLWSYFYHHQALLVLLECDWLMVSDGSGSSQSCSVEGWALLKTRMWRKSQLSKVPDAS